MKYLFVDFDGVLHGEEYNEDYFAHSKMFCDRLEQYQENFRIVVSSSWREVYEWDILVEAFEKPIQHLVVAHTPILVEGFTDGGRYLEIKQYCEENNIKDEQWKAIDDMDRLFPKNCSNLILTNPLVGLTPKNMDLIEDFVKYPYLKNKLKP
jgi:hypothetical protein